MSDAMTPTTCCPRTRAALAALAGAAPDRVLCCSPQGEPVTAQGMLALYDARDPMALAWDAAVHGAALRMMAVASRLKKGEPTPNSTEPDEVTR